MAYPDIIDFDKIVSQALSGINKAIHGWLSGQPHEEVALMNRITEQFTRSRRNCDVGIKMPVTMESKVYQLHRRGSQGQDQYGSDLAITISVPELDWIKTALFQMKSSNDASVVVERHQIYEASKDNQILERAFVIAVDKQRGLIRIESASKIWDIFKSLPTEQKTRTIDCSHWDGLVSWLHQWLRCDVGAESKSDDPKRVESLLRSFVLEPTLIEPFDVIQAEQIENYLPVRLWMQLLFRGTSTQEKLGLKRSSI